MIVVSLSDFYERMKVLIKNNELNEDEKELLTNSYTETNKELFEFIKGLSKDYEGEVNYDITKEEYEEWSVVATNLWRKIIRGMEDEL